MKWERMWGRAPDGDWSPYLTRLSVGPFFLHIFHRGDGDPDCHDHRRAFWTFPLTGYVEERLHHPTLRRALLRARGEDPPQPTLQHHVVEPFRLHFREAESAHRIVGRWSGLRNRWRSPRGVRSSFPVPCLKRGRIITIGMWDRWAPPRDWGFWVRRERWRVSWDAAGQQVNERLADGFRWVPWRKYVFGEEA